MSSRLEVVAITYCLQSECLPQSQHPFGKEKKLPLLTTLSAEKWWRAESYMSHMYSAVNWVCWPLPMVDDFLCSVVAFS